MNIDKVHVPERLEGESMLEYRERQHMSKRLASRQRLLHAAGKPYRASAAKRTRRALVAAIGVRQLKKILRANQLAREVAA